MTLAFLSKVISRWSDDGATTFSAALAYYAAFSIAPLLLISLAVASLLFGHTTPRQPIFDVLQNFLGDPGAKAVQTLVAGASLSKKAGTTATLVGGATLLFGATGLFTELQDDLNLIWGVRSRRGSGKLNWVKTRLLSLIIVITIAILLLGSLVISARIFPGPSHWVPGANEISGLRRIFTLALSYGATTALFSALFKILPNVKLMWREVVKGSALTALLFELGKLGMGYYVRNSGIAATFGAAGSLVIVLLWVYYSSCILFFGAEFIKVQVIQTRGRRLRPKAGAILIPQHTK